MKVKSDIQSVIKTYNTAFFKEWIECLKVPDTLISHDSKKGEWSSELTRASHARDERSTDRD